MKKVILLAGAALMMGLGASAQPVSDRAVVPMAINLNQVLRLRVIDGGNIEFVFNTIEEYRLGFSGDVATSGSSNNAATEDFYRTTIEVTSSTTWHLDYGVEDDFQPVDYAVGNTPAWPGSNAPGAAAAIAKENVGFTINSLGNWALGAAAETVAPLNNDDGTAINALDTYPTAVLTAGPLGNAGDGNDNIYQFVWRVGTQETNAGGGTDMVAQDILTQDFLPGRYITNLFFDLQAY